jgi:hypothetical protein
MPPKEKAPKCPVQGCQTRLNASTSGSCKQCKGLFCKEHSFPTDHQCMRLSSGLSRSASAPQLVPKVQPGVLVSATAASKLKGDGAAPAPQKVRGVAVACSEPAPGGRAPPPAHFLRAKRRALTGGASGAAQAAQAAPTAAATAATLQQLQSAQPQQLLDGLLGATPGAASEAQSVLLRALGDDSAEVRCRRRRLRAARSSIQLPHMRGVGACACA